MDFDTLHDYANNHKALRQFLGHKNLWYDHYFSHKSLEQDIKFLDLT